MYDFYKMNLYDLQTINISYFTNIEKLLSFNEIENIILKHPIKDYPQAFIQNDSVPVIYKILRDYKEEKITIEGLLFMIDGEYNNIPIQIFQTIFHDLYNLVQNKLIVLKIKRIKFLIILIGRLSILHKRSRNKIKKRLNPIYY